MCPRAGTHTYTTERYQERGNRKRVRDIVVRTEKPTARGGGGGTQSSRDIQRDPAGQQFWDTPPGSLFPGRHLPVKELRVLKTRSVLLRRRSAGRKEKPMARRRTRARITARIMKPMLMWMRTGGKVGNAPDSPLLSKVTLQSHPQQTPLKFSHRHPQYRPQCHRQSHLLETP